MVSEPKSLIKVEVDYPRKWSDERVKQLRDGIDEAVNRFMLTLTEDEKKA